MTSEPTGFDHLPRWRHALAMGALIAAGEAVFFLPFVVARIFRPTLLDVFGLTNFELGLAFSVYGLVAMAAYFAGGFLADRYPANRLMAVALGATGLGGLVMVQVPGLGTLKILFGYWGLTTIFLFWAALIRATRMWGGANRQGSAYGLLDGGRGLFAALMASVSVAIFAGMLPGDAATATLAERSAALVRTIWIFTGMTVAAGVLVWIAVPEERRPAGKRAAVRPVFSTGVLRMPTVWLQAVIVLCAYVGYKAGDDFGLFVRDTFGYDDVGAAQMSTISFWIRPFAALGAGLLADRMRASRVLVLGFLVLMLGGLGIASGWLRADPAWMIVATVAATAVGIHSLRGVYFAVMGEAEIPWAITGSAVGVISLVGYTPDIFMGPLMGYLLDRAPGAAGHQHLWAVVAGFALIGLVAALTLPWVAASRSGAER
jgi:nitrate/nitrite transporter NarK